MIDYTPPLRPFNLSPAAKCSICPKLIHPSFYICPACYFKEKSVGREPHSPLEPDRRYAEWMMDYLSDARRSL